jgi:hypothetical protein
MWENQNLKPNDALHIASAIMAGVSIMDTFDKDLIKLDGMIGTPPLRKFALYEKPDRI